MHILLGRSIPLGGCLYYFCCNFVAFSIINFWGLKDERHIVYMHSYIIEGFIRITRLSDPFPPLVVGYRRSFEWFVTVARWVNADPDSGIFMRSSLVLTIQKYISCT